MKICLAQQQYFSGDIQANTESHQLLISKAIAQKADAIYFPELSLTGYEPELAAELSFEDSDGRLLPFQVLSNENKIVIALGVPIKRENGITISMAIFQPGKQVLFYDKKYLHVDELPYFIPGENLETSCIRDGQAALAICYELSIPDHARNAITSEVNCYLASVAKFKDGVEEASKRMAEIATSYGIHTLMVNAVGKADGGLCTGNSSVWGPDGQLLARLDDQHSGLLLFDTKTGDIIAFN